MSIYITFGRYDKKEKNMSNIQVSYTIQSGEKIYILTIDDKGNPDLLYTSGSLKAKRLAKETAIDLIEEIG